MSADSAGFLRVSSCNGCGFSILEPQGDTCECGGALSTVVNHVERGTRIGIVRQDGAYWVLYGKSTELMYWTQDHHGLPCPSRGRWTQFGAEEVGYALGDDDVEVLDGPVGPPRTGR